MSRWLTVFLLISCYSVACSKAGSPCSGFHGATSDVCGLIGENISLTCNVPTNCTRGLWKYDDTITPMWLLPEEYRGDTYVFSFNSSEGLNTLHIYNINESVEGFYTCSCDDYNQWRTDQACFNLSVHEVHYPISVQINGEKHVFDKWSLRDAVEMVDVKVNQNITIKCDERGKRRTNCSHIGEHFQFTVNSSHHLCGFGCRPKEESVKRKVFSIILNVIDNTISTTTAMPKTEIYTSRTQKSITNASETFPPSSTDPSTATEQKQSTKTQNITSVESDQEFTSKTVTTQTSRTSTHVGNTNSFASYTPLPISATVNVNHGNTSSMSSTQELSTDESLWHIIVASCIILVLAIIILILCVHITFFKIGIRSCNDKEEWVNPIYESADNGAQLPIAIPDGGNPYDTVNSPRLVADFSNAVSTSNNVHQINANLGRANEIPMVQLETSKNVKLLDYTVTPSNVGSMKSNKPICKKVKNSAAATETLSLPKADDISPPPASPHLYEILNDSVRP